MSEILCDELLVREAPKPPEQYRLLALLLVGHQNLMVMGHGSDKNILDTCMKLSKNGK